MRRGGRARVARARSHAVATGRRSSPSRGRGVTTSAPSCSTTPARAADPRRSGTAHPPSSTSRPSRQSRDGRICARAMLRGALPRHPVALRLEERQRFALRAPARDGHARRAVRQQAQHVLPGPRMPDQPRREEPDRVGHRRRGGTGRRGRRRRHLERRIEHEPQLGQQRLHAGSRAAASRPSTSASTSVWTCRRARSPDRRKPSATAVSRKARKPRQ